LSGAACAAHQPARATSSSNADKHACGSHEPGKCAAATGAPSPPDQPFSVTRTETIAPGGRFEVNLSFASGAHARATFKASASLAWNVHSHPAGGVVEHEEGAVASGNISFETATMHVQGGGAAAVIALVVGADTGARCGGDELPAERLIMRGRWR